MNRLALIPLIVFAIFYLSIGYAKAQTTDCYNGQTILHTIMLTPILNCLDNKQSGTFADSTSATNLGSGAGVFAQEVGDQLQFKSVKGSPDIAVSASGTELAIDYNGTLATESTICGNVGSGKLVHVTSSNCNAKSIVGSSDISVTNTSNTIVIDYNGTAVTSVSGTSPIVSSGGTTPAISCPTCLTTSSSWVILDNKTATNALTTFTSNTFTGYKYLKIEILDRKSVV